MQVNLQKFDYLGNLGKHIGEANPLTGEIIKGTADASKTLKLK